MFSWIISLLPWWVWALCGIVVIGVVHRLVGWKGLAGLGALFLAISAYRKGNSEGRQEVIDEHLQDLEKLNETYDEIDSPPPDFDGSINRLRNRSGK